MAKRGVEMPPRPRTTPISGPPLKVEEAAKLAGCCQKSIRKLIVRGYVPCIRFGRVIRLPRAAFMRWLNEGQTVPSK
jgi:excisionase family DNA binding protein